MTTYQWEIDAGLEYMAEEAINPTPLPPSSSDEDGDEQESEDETS
jgi:hypothetical protein